MDFTRQKYKQLLQALLTSGVSFSLRHDVDKRPYHSLALAQIEAEMGVYSVFYFRCVPCSNNPEVIRQIVALGHEIGYHYEDLSICHGNPAAAMEHFQHWLNYFRQFYPVHRICMHGAPTSQWDSRDLWQTYNYHDFDIDYEPYFDEDFTQTFYLTDTGRRWDGYKVSVRDKVPQQDTWTCQGLTFHTTDDIIAFLLAQRSNRPSGRSTSASVQLAQRSILITTHPQRWTDSLLEWTKEMLLQSLKNSIKRILIWARKS